MPNLDSRTEKVTDYTPPRERVFVLLPTGPVTQPVVFGSREACALFYGEELAEKLIETTIVS